MFWSVVGTLWLIALAALFYALRMPHDMDVYFHDTYVVIARTHAIVLLGLFLILLSVVTLLRLRAQA